MPGLSSPLSLSPTAIAPCTTSIPPFGDRKDLAPLLPPCPGSGHCSAGLGRVHGAARLPCGPGERPEAAAEPEAIYVPVATQPHRPHLWSRRAHAWGQVVQRGVELQVLSVAQVSLRRALGSREKKGKPPEPSVFLGWGVRCSGWGAVKCNIGLDV